MLRQTGILLRIDGILRAEYSVYDSHAGLVGLFLKICVLKECADETVCLLADPGSF